jgi:hypothetical protein
MDLEALLLRREHKLSDVSEIVRGVVDHTQCRYSSTSSVALQQSVVQIVPTQPVLINGSELHRVSM